MPRIRQQFAEHLPERVERAREAVRQLSDGVGPHSGEAGHLFAVAHDLSGTAGTFGAVQLGEAATRMAGLVRPWITRDAPPSSAEIERLEAELSELEARTGEFFAWLSWEADQS